MAHARVDRDRALFVHRPLARIAGEPVTQVREAAVQVVDSDPQLLGRAGCPPEHGGHGLAALDELRCAGAVRGDVARATAASSAWKAATSAGLAPSSAPPPSGLHLEAAGLAEGVSWPPRRRAMETE